MSALPKAYMAPAKIHCCCCVQVREIYEMAIEGQEPYQLTDEDTKKMCQR